AAASPPLQHGADRERRARGRNEDRRHHDEEQPDDHQRPFALCPGRSRALRHGASVGSVSHAMSYGSESHPDQIAAEVRGEPCNVADYEWLARERLDPGAYGYYAGGAGDER